MMLEHIFYDFDNAPVSWGWFVCPSGRLRLQTRVGVGKVEWTKVEPALVKKASGRASGHVLLATVQGDIHDIGKNIFGVLLRCHGFTVTDLGVDVEPAQIAAEALRLRPDIIALSGLLTISYDSRRATLQAIQKLEQPAVAQTPSIIGGGTVNAMVCGHVGADYWATDGMVGVQLCKQIMAERK